MLDIVCRFAARDSLTPMRRTEVAILIACLVGIPAGVGAFTFVYAKGFSCLCIARACVNCHIMTPQYDAWQKSGHRHAAICVACHLRDAGIASHSPKEVDDGNRVQDPPHG
jgi:cytochrome c nitrite reductase small subunit